MTRKDYVALAGALRQTQPTIADFTTTSPDGANTFTNRISHDAAYAAWSETVCAIANVLAADNGRFDRDRFTRATEGKK